MLRTPSTSTKHQTIQVNGRLYVEEHDRIVRNMEYEARRAARYAENIGVCLLFGILIFGLVAMA